VQANIAVTESPATGYKAIQTVIETIGLLDREDFPEASVDQQIDRRVIRHLSRIATIQKRDHTEMQLSVARADHGKPLSARFGSNAISAVRSLQAPTFRIEATTLYGRLIQLLDRTADEDDSDEKGFWGQLIADDGEYWRVQFKPSQVEKASGLFRKQVKVTGNAVYYRIAHPKLVCEDIAQDVERDYEAAFDDLYGCNKQVYKTDLQTLLKQIHGEE